MKPWAKAGIVLAGYGLAVVASMAAGWAYDARMAKMPYDTSGGMYAGGQMLTGLGTFLAVAVVPTLLGLWFLRGQPRLWYGIGVVAVGFAALGLVAVLAPIVHHHTYTHPAGMVLDLFGLAQLLGVPIWTGAFVLFTLAAPTQAARRLMMSAVGIELVIGVCAAIHWFVPRPPF